MSNFQTFGLSRGAPPGPTRVNFGSAQLFVDDMPESVARKLLDSALETGVTRLDTAPLYGHGSSEALVARVAAGWPGVVVSTKVGLEPSPAPSRWRVVAGSALRRMPGSVRNRLRAALGKRAPPSQAEGPSGRFAILPVRQSIERSLARLGHLDRLLLHEVHPADVTDDLLELLLEYRRRGDVAALGVATGNDVTLEALARSRGLFTVAHVSVDPLGAPLPSLATLPDVRLVGHGALGPAGLTLAHVRARLVVDPALAERWDDAAAGTRYAGREGVADALLARAADTFGGELIVATRRLDKIPSTVSAASGSQSLPGPLQAVLSETLATMNALEKVQE